MPTRAQLEALGFSSDAGREIKDEIGTAFDALFAPGAKPPRGVTPHDVETWLRKRSHGKKGPAQP